MRQQDFLYEGLPCIVENGNYILYSPYSLKIAVVDKRDFPEPFVQKYFETFGFFGKPCQQPDKRLSKLTLILTNNCNLRCTYCYMSGGEGKMIDLPMDRAVEAIRMAVAPETKELRISMFGGEATLHINHIKKIVDYTKSLGLDIAFHISTNGVISKSTIDYLAQEKFLIGISMDGPPYINDLHRPLADGSKSSEYVESTIKEFAKKGARLLVRATVSHLNVNHMVEAVEYWASLGVSYIHIEPLNVSGRAILSHLKQPDVDEYIDSMKNIADKCKQLGIYVLSSPFMNLLTPSRYYCGTTAGESFSVTPDSAISKCYEVQNRHHDRQEFLVGKYNEKTGKFEIDNRKNRSLRNLSVEIFGQCRECFVKYLCGGVCHLRNINATRSLFEVDPFSCKIRKVLIKDALLRIKDSVHTQKVAPVLGINSYEHYLSWRPNGFNGKRGYGQKETSRNVGEEIITANGKGMSILSFPLPEELKSFYNNLNDGAIIRRIKDRCESVF